MQENSAIKYIFYMAALIVVILLWLDIRQCFGPSVPLPGTVVQQSDTVVKKDTIYIPTPRYITRTRVERQKDTIVIRDTTVRGDTVTVVHHLPDSVATIDIRYAPERLYVDTVQIRTERVEYQTTPWYEKVFYYTLGLATGVVFLILAR